MFIFATGIQCAIFNFTEAKIGYLARPSIEIADLVHVSANKLALSSDYL
jgi:hypothetical protein